METENTLENKRKFFALYWGQRVEKWNGRTSPSLVDSSTFGDYNMRHNWLELKPLSQISDEDAIELCDIWYNRRHNSLGSKIARSLDKSHLTWNTKISLKAHDYLRSKGYALPWVGLSVEEQIEYGWVKFKSN